MTINDIKFKLSEFSMEDLSQLENFIQKERQHRASVRRSELCGKIIKDLEVFQKEFPYESIVFDCPKESNKIAIYPEDIISQIKDNWMDNWMV